MTLPNRNGPRPRRYAERVSADQARAETRNRSRFLLVPFAVLQPKPKRDDTHLVQAPSLLLRESGSPRVQLAGEPKTWSDPFAFARASRTAFPRAVTHILRHARLTTTDSDATKGTKTQASLARMASSVRPPIKSHTCRHLLYLTSSIQEWQENAKKALWFARHAFSAFLPCPCRADPTTAFLAPLSPTLVNFHRAAWPAPCRRPSRDAELFQKVRARGNHSVQTR
jgi:hypothetical protein